MAEYFLKADGWFINLVAVGGAIYFLWSMKNTLAGLRQDISELKGFLQKLFDKHDDHERRISRIEGICKGRRSDDGNPHCGG